MPYSEEAGWPAKTTVCRRNEINYPAWRHRATYARYTVIIASCNTVRSGEKETERVGVRLTLAGGEWKRGFSHKFRESSAACR